MDCGRELKDEEDLDRGENEREGMPAHKLG